MRRADRSKDPRFTTAAARRQNLDELHAIVQTWISTFPDMAALDAQFDEAKIAMGEIRGLRELGESEWADYWGAVQEVPDRSGGSFRLPGRPWKFASESLDPLGPPAFQGEHNAEVFGEIGLSREDITAAHAAGDRKRAVEGKSVYVRVDLGGGRVIKKK